MKTSYGVDTDYQKGHIINHVPAGLKNCFDLRNVDPQKTFTNAESYKWLALKCWYRDVCAQNLGDPVEEIEAVREDIVVCRVKGD